MASFGSVTQAFKFISSHPQLKPVCLSLVSCLVLKHVVWYFLARRTYKNTLQRRRSKANLRKAAVERQFTQELNVSADILDKSITDLLQALKNGSISAVQVLHAFQTQALELTKNINCIIEPIEEAGEQAYVLDTLSEKTGLLHGIPISVKENVNISGYDSTAGLSVNIGNNATEDALVIQVLKKHGAIPFVRTNIPQTMLSYCCSNPLYGETLHPHDKSRSPGGSSGGEGAIIGGGASIIGIGTDLGGSLRVPAVFCGIYALKTTRGRISPRGVYTLSRGNLAIPGVIGPIARDFESLLLLSRALMSPEMIELDRSLPNLPFNMKEFEQSSRLRIGFYTYDGTCQCQPSVVRAVLEAKAALENMGHEVVPFNFYSVLGSEFQNGEFFIRLMFADRGERLRKLVGNDYAELSVQTIMKLGRLPKWLVKAGEFLLKQFDKFGSSIIGASKGYDSLYEYFGHVSKFMDWQESFMKTWMDENLDAVICPVFPSSAVTRDIIPFVAACGIYCQMYNSLNYPAGVIPVTKVTQEDLDNAFNHKIFTPNSTVDKLLLKSSKGSVGLSVGVQCVALPYKDEMCLRVMREIERGLKN